jgi:hypothetical protein
MAKSTGSASGNRPAATNAVEKVAETLYLMPGQQLPA